LPPPVPPSVDPDLVAGLEHHRAGRLDRAEACYRKVLRRVPRHPDALNLLGVIAYEKGRFTRAIQLASQALQIQRNFPSALANLARAQRAAGELEAALDSARRAVAFDPALPEAQIQLAICLLDSGDAVKSAEVGRVAIRLAPHTLDAYVNLGAALTILREWHEAVRIYQTAHQLKPDRVETLIDFAKALTGISLHQDAVRCYARAARLEPLNATALSGLAIAQKRAGDPKAAADSIRRAVEIEPDNPSHRIVLGGIMSSLGRFADAAAAFNAALKLEPDSAEARRGLVAAGQLQTDAAEITRLIAIADDTGQRPGQRIAAAFALGRLYEAAEDYDPAFDRFVQANNMVKQLHHGEGEAFDRIGFEKYIDDMIRAFTPERFEMMRGWGDPSEVPVFIVGMPRSGTTLTEQIAASHPLVHGAGELPAISQIVSRLNHAAVNPGAWRRDDVAREAAAHVAALRTLGGCSVSRITDKMPDNVMLLGAIAVLFPRARIVICRRDLRDVCLSCYVQHFAAGLSWTNDLSDLGFRARQTERLVDHWRQVLPIPVLEVRYEELVADLEGQSRRLIDFIGLEWDPACLTFHDTDRPVLTASQWQVRQPLYNTSVGRWRLYQERLTPLFEALGPAAETAPSA
jgi:tetratricopeptide (TPR) repeat protein